MLEGVVDVANKRLIQLIHRISQQSNSILIGSFDKFVPVYSEQGTSEFWQESALVVHTPRLKKFATRFLKSRVVLHPPQSSSNFISFHFRRRDFISFHPEEYAQVEEVAVALHRLTLEHSCFVVVICTDGEQEEVDAIRQALLWYNPFTLLYQFTNDDEQKWGRLSSSECAVVEQIIASRGKVFVGSMHSFFSTVIHYERLARGFPRSTGIQLLHSNTVPFYYW
jgi:hypothetical protein